MLSLLGIGTSKQIIFTFIVLFGILASISPFIHMLFPKQNPKIEILEEKLKNNEISSSIYKNELSMIKKSDKVFGFRNKRSFLYSIGHPFSGLVFSLIVMYVLQFIHNEEIKNALKIATILFMSISCYFIIWIFWDKSDLPDLAYYIMIGISSITSSFLSYKFISHHNRLIDTLFTNIKDLISFMFNNTKKDSENKMWDILERVGYGKK